MAVSRPHDARRIACTRCPARVRRVLVVLAGSVRPPGERGVSGG
jgi:hypothetical protein